MAISSYKCPNCGADLPYDIKSKNLKCLFCGSEYNIDDLDEKNIEKVSQNEEIKWEHDDYDDSELDGKVGYVCSSCGAEIIADENAAALTCPYCTSSVIVNEKITGVFKPQIIIPFKLTKEEAKDKYSNYTKGKILLPNDFKARNIIKNIHAIYVPYFLFDADADASATYKTTRSHTYVSGDYEITETTHYRVYRSGNASLVKIPVDASKKLDDALMDSIEPFDYSESKIFDKIYLASFLADKYDVNEEETSKKANYRIKNTMISELSSSVYGYDTVNLEYSNVSIKNGKSTYAFLPVYLFTTKYNGNIYQFAMNGQTGKFAGNLPIDKIKRIKYLLIIFIITFILTFLIFFIVNGGLK